MLNLELKIPPVVLTLIFAFFIWLASIQVSQGSIHLPYLIILAIIFGAIGITFALAGVLSFRKAKTTVDPTKPNSSSTIVHSGVYRISRNPMYVGFLFILLGWCIFLSNLIAFVFLPFYVLYMNRFQIIPEEHILATKFGDEYMTYKQSVRRWL